MTCPKVVLTNVGILQYCAQVTDPEPRLAGSFGKLYFQSLKKKTRSRVIKCRKHQYTKICKLGLAAVLVKVQGCSYTNCRLTQAGGVKCP